jgi:hypothetical protein
VRAFHPLTRSSHLLSLLTSQTPPVGPGREPVPTAHPRDAEHGHRQQVWQTEGRPRRYVVADAVRVFVLPCHSTTPTNATEFDLKTGVLRGARAPDDGGGDPRMQGRRVLGRDVGSLRRRR